MNLISLLASHVLIVQCIYSIIYRSIKGIFKEESSIGGLVFCFFFCFFFLVSDKWIIQEIFFQQL